MIKFANLLCSSFLLIANAGRAETLFGPGAIPIATNETILITTMAGNRGYSPLIYLFLDGVDVTPQPRSDLPGFIVIAGPHRLVVTNANESVSDFFITFQRLTNSAIRTVLTLPNSTNLISVPIGKTVQLFDPLGLRESIVVKPQDSTTWFDCFALQGLPFISISGPATIAIAAHDYGNNLGTALSYYFTDDRVQFPPGGLLVVPAPILEVNIERSFDCTNWSPTATFHTGAEANAFYRLRMVK